MTSPTVSRPPFLTVTIALSAILLMLSGCGSDPSAAQAMPPLGKQLGVIDADIAGGHEHAARAAVAELTSMATRGESEGRITADQAQSIVDAANALLAAMPSSGPSASSSASARPKSRHSHVAAPKPSKAKHQAPHPPARPKGIPPGHAKKPGGPPGHGPGHGHGH